MIDEEYLNNLDDSLDNLYDSDLVYEYHFPVEPGWGQHHFVVWDSWDVGRWPMLLVKYETPDKEIYLRLTCKDEDSYKTVDIATIDFGSGNPFPIITKPTPLSFFFETSDDNKLLPGSEKKCIRIMERFWNLRAFL